MSNLTPEQASKILNTFLGKKMYFNVEHRKTEATYDDVDEIFSNEYQFSFIIKDIEVYESYLAISGPQIGEEIIINPRCKIYYKQMLTGGIEVSIYEHDTTIQIMTTSKWG